MLAGNAAFELYVQWHWILIRTKDLMLDATYPWKQEEEGCKCSYIVPQAFRWSDVNFSASAATSVLKQNENFPRLWCAQVSVLFRSIVFSLAGRFVCAAQFPTYSVSFGVKCSLSTLETESLLSIQFRSHGCSSVANEPSKYPFCPCWLPPSSREDDELSENLTAAATLPDDPRCLYINTHL